VNFIICCLLTCELFINLFNEELYLLFGLCFVYYFGLVLVSVWTFTLIRVHDNPLVII